MAKSKTNTTEPTPAEKKPRLSLVSMADLCDEGTEPDWLVERVLVRDQPMVIGGPHKSLKTSLALDLAVSLATGTKFLGTFGVPRACKVAVFSGESSGQTINETLQRICRLKGQDPKGCDVLCGLTLPRLGSAADRKELRHLIREHGVEVVIIDPLGAMGALVTFQKLTPVPQVVAPVATPELPTRTNNEQPIDPRPATAADRVPVLADDVDIEEEPSETHDRLRVGVTC